mmetsp:Transcript_18815/g.52462  ORF Transcript_18815/g.52462 Transcript_18815/m.52462 type:complete len:239 (+) Transcript_18815:1296-2012(+)
MARRSPPRIEDSRALSSRQLPGARLPAISIWATRPLAAAARGGMLCGVAMAALAAMTCRAPPTSTRPAWPDGTIMPAATALSAIRTLSCKDSSSKPRSSAAAFTIARTLPLARSHWQCWLGSCRVLSQSLMASKAFLQRISTCRSYSHVASEIVSSGDGGWPPPRGRPNPHGEPGHGPRLPLPPRPCRPATAPPPRAAAAGPARAATSSVMKAMRRCVKTSLCNHCASSCERASSLRH